MNKWPKKRMPRLRMKKSVALSLSFLLGLSIILFVTILLFNVTDYGITIASFGATIFMLLSRKNLSSRKVFGAYLIGGVLGYISSRFSMVTSLNASIAVLSSVLLMTFLEFQHAPAIGLSVAMVLNRFSLWVNIFIILCLFLILGLIMILKMFVQEPEKLSRFIDLEEEKIKWNLKSKNNPKYIEIGG